MEALAILFVIGIFYFLTAKVKPPDPPSAGDQLMKGLKAVVADLKGDKKKEEPDSSFPFGVVATTIFIGLVLIYVL